MSNGARFAARPVAEGGTASAVWLGWRRVFPTLDLADCPALTVVAPHPDDETLGFGASAATIRAKGIDVRVVSATDGGGAYPDLSARERTWLETDRRAELRRAIDALGLDAPIHLGLPDGRLAEHEATLADTLTGVLEQAPAASWCAATWRGDGHPDHEAVGRAAATACERTGTTLLEYPVWMWHWAQPEDDRVPWDSMSVVSVDRAAVVRKHAAARAFHSQLSGHGAHDEPVLPYDVVQRLFAVGEVVFR